MIIYDEFILKFNCKKNSGQFYVEDSSFLNLNQISCLNEFIHTLEFKYIEIKALVQILCTEYI